MSDANKASRFENIVVRIFSHDFLSRFRWYRRRCGGFWVYSNVMGWRERKTEWTIGLDLELCSTNPEMYDGGKDIEDYRLTTCTDERMCVPCYTGQGECECLTSNEKVT